MIKMADPVIKEEEINEVIEVLRSGHIAQGKKVTQFENDFADKMCVEYAVATSSGTAALHTALLLCGVGTGDEVIVPAFSFFSTASMINACGADPVFADVSQYDGMLLSHDVENLITIRTKAIIVTNMFGELCPAIGQIQKIAEDYNLFLIVDSCQYPTNRGAIYGDISCFSFYATKNITTGEGGMITTNDIAFEKRARRIINHGQSRKYFHTDIGFNYRMTDIAAAIGIGQLKRIDSIHRRRREIAELYNRLITTHCVEKPRHTDTHVYHQYVILVKRNYTNMLCNGNRDDLSKYLAENDIETAIHYPIPIPMQPVYRTNEIGNNFISAKNLSKSCLSIPCHPMMLDEDVEKVSTCINKFFDGVE